MALPNVLHIVLGFATTYYAVVLIGLAIGLRRLKYHPSEKKPFVSVIVAACNEETNIASLLECLVHQNYPIFEVIIVNDRSSDRTPAIVGEFQSRFTNIHRIDISETSKDMPTKKYALSQAIASSKGEILCFTDADCLPPRDWIRALVAGFDEKVGLVAGYSPYLSPILQKSTRVPVLRRLFYRFIEYEEFKGASWSGGAIGLQKGWLCTGRSLAYRSKVFAEVGGFEKIKQSISGDDDLFLQLVRRETSWQIRYVTSPESFVPTLPPGDFAHFIQQRTRHFSAGKFFPISMKAIFFAFHASNLAIFLSFLGFLLFGPDSVPIWPFLVKCLVDSLLFLAAAPVFLQTSFAPSFLLMEILYILYNSIVGPMGFVSQFTWKPEKNS